MNYSDNNVSQSLTKCALHLKTARMDTLAVVVLTVINILFLAMGKDTYFIFSASIPYYLVVFGFIYGGRMPAEFYDSGTVVYGDSFYYLMFSAALLLIVAYTVLFFLTKKYEKLITVILFLFSADCILLIFIGLKLGMAAVNPVDILMHAFIMYYLIMGTVSYFKKKKLMSEASLSEASEVSDISDTPDESENIGDSENMGE